MPAKKTCLDACRERGYDDAIEYGISAQYARTRQWGLWEIFREFMQNALDEEHYVKSDVPVEYLCREEPGKTIIYDHGRGISVNNLLLGESRKEPWQRGKFGEGMKLAMLGALVSGFRVTIRSRDKLIEPIIIPRVYEDREIEILCACIKKGLPPTVGTEVTIHGVELCQMFKRRVIQGILDLDPECILYSFRNNSKEWRDVIDKRCTEERGAIYLRDLYVASVVDVFPDVSDSIYSYNLFDVTIDESRKIPSSSSVYDDVRHVLMMLVRVAVDSPTARKILKNIIEQVLSTPKGVKPYFEATIYLYPFLLTSRERQVIIDIFNELYGEDAVVVTDIKDYEYARYLGLRAIYCTESLCYALTDILDTKGRIAKKQEGYLRLVIDLKRAMPEFYEVVKVLEDIGELLTGFRTRGIKLYYAIMDPDKAGQAQTGGIVLINLHHLLRNCASDPVSCIRHFLAVLAHEIAHLECNLCDDTSAEYPSTLTEVMGKALGRAIREHERLGALLKDLISAHKRWVESIR
jgi:hypothetical protein